MAVYFVLRCAIIVLSASRLASANAVDYPVGVNLGQYHW